MKNFNVFGVHGKIQVLEGGFMKNQYIPIYCLKKGGFGQFADLRQGDLARNGDCFFGGWG